MANTYTPLLAVTGGKKDLIMKVRAAHIWCIQNKKDPNDITFMNILLVNEKGGRMHATVRRSLISKFKAMVKEGGTYELENAMVGFNDGQFKLTSHKYKLNMMNHSKFTRINAPKLPMNVFDFMAFKDILASTEEEKIIDVIGHVTEKDSLRETDKNGRKNRVIDLTLEDLEHNRLHCSLWGEFADKMSKYFETNDNSEPLILILQFCKTRKYLGAMDVANSFYGTNVILNGILPEVEAYKRRMKSAEIYMSQGVSQMSTHSTMSLSEDFLKTKRMTIENMIEANEVCQGFVLATVCEIETGVDWYFRSCSQCASLVTVDDGKLCCKKCRVCKSTVPRFKLHVIVMDDTGSTTFVLFDRVVTQFIGRSVQDLIDGAKMANKDNDYHADLNAFIDKQFLFKVEVSEGNVARRYKNFAVKKATDDAGVIDEFMSKYNLKKSNEESTVDNSVGDAAARADNVIMEVLEGGDSCSDTNMVNTPVSKSALKRSYGSIESVAVGDVEIGQASVTQPTKMVRVKIEPPEKN